MHGTGLDIKVRTKYVIVSLHIKNYAMMMMMHQPRGGEGREEMGGDLLHHRWITTSQQGWFGPIFIRHFYLSSFYVALLFSKHSHVGTFLRSLVVYWLDLAACAVWCFYFVPPLVVCLA